MCSLQRGIPRRLPSSRVSSCSPSTFGLRPGFAAKKGAALEPRPARSRDRGQLFFFSALAFSIACIMKALNLS